MARVLSAFFARSHFFEICLKTNAGSTSPKLHTSTIRKYGVAFKTHLCNEFGAYLFSRFWFCIIKANRNRYFLRLFFVVPLDYGRVFDELRDEQESAFYNSLVYKTKIKKQCELQISRPPPTALAVVRLHRILLIS